MTLKMKYKLQIPTLCMVLLVAVFLVVFWQSNQTIANTSAQNEALGRMDDEINKVSFVIKDYINNEVSFESLQKQFGSMIKVLDVDLLSTGKKYVQPEQILQKVGLVNSLRIKNGDIEKEVFELTESSIKNSVTYVRSQAQRLADPETAAEVTTIERLVILGANTNTTANYDIQTYFLKLKENLATRDVFIPFLDVAIEGTRIDIENLKDTPFAELPINTLKANIKIRELSIVFVENVEQEHALETEIFQDMANVITTIETFVDKNNKAAFDLFSNIILIMLVLVGLIALLFGVYNFFFARKLSGAIETAVAITDDVSKGIIDAEGYEEYLNTKSQDELGRLRDAISSMIESLQYKGNMVEEVAKGNLTIDVKLASDKDVLGTSLVQMTDSLNSLLGNVNMSVDQVNIGADQVAQASQSLSQGATESASSLEEVSASITQINSQSRQNAENATEANGLAKQATEDAERGNKEMEGLSVAMEKINDSSDQIKKIVKVIDDIAFQTNLLALNANVEAARAGKYGKGFAVVADEVRNLAVRSAEAVKETTEMVDNSIKNIESGNKAVEATATQLESIMGGSSKVADFLEEIAVASKEQAEAIDQITKGLEQIDQVTQSNTASAEESAAAAEELASQSVHLKNMIATFKLRDVQASHSAQPKQIVYQSPAITYESTQQTEAGVKSVAPEAVIALDDDDFDRF